MFAVFNRPSSTEDNNDSTLDDFLLDAFRCAAEGSRVRGSVDHWTNVDFTEELRSIADERQLLLRLTTGESSQDEADIPSEVRDFFSSIERGIAAPVDPDGFPNHLKFFCFDNIDLAALGEMYPANVVAGTRLGQNSRAMFLTSANIMEVGKHNAAVLVPITEEVRLKLCSYWNDLYAEYDKLTSWWAAARAFFSCDPDHADRYATVTSPLQKLYFYPQTDGTDTIANVLKSIEHFGRNPGTPCTVQLVTPRFRDSRVEVARTMKTLFENGARIEVVTRSRADEFPEGVPELGSEVAGILGECAHLYFQNPDMNIHSK